MRTPPVFVYKRPCFVALLGLAFYVKMRYNIRVGEGALCHLNTGMIGFDKAFVA